MRQMRIATRVPALVDPVDDARQATFRRNALSEPVQPGAERLGRDLARISLAHRRDMAGVIHARLQERNSTVELDAVHLERMPRNAEPVQPLSAEYALVSHVMDSQ